MAIVRSTRKAGDPLTPEQIARLDALKDRPSVYDPECPPLTDEQLAEFRPVNGMTMEERYREMRAAGIVDPELKAERVDIGPADLCPADHHGHRKGA